MTTKASKLIGLRLPSDLYNLISKKAKAQHRPLSNYIKNVLINELDATDYLLSTEANKASMYQMLEDEKKDGSLTFENIDEVKKYVQNLSN